MKRTKSMKNIVLIGMPGSGKTTVGKILAEKLSLEFIDLDSLIVFRQGKSIPQIFEEQGEEGFRRAETEAVREVFQSRGVVIACGGGVVTKEINMHLLSQKGIVIFMNRPVEDVLKRVNLNTRPLLRNDPDKFHVLHRERLPLYRKYADFEVNCGQEKSKVLKQLTHISQLSRMEIKLAVIGDPIDHSLSPHIHIPAIQPFVESVSYERVRIEKDHLEKWITDARGTGLWGFNVTMPHKEAILPFLDRADKETRELRSANTVVNRKGALWGYSTDGTGFCSALASGGESFKGAVVTVIGSGGAAVTIAMKAAEKGARELHLSARDRDKAAKIAQKIQSLYGLECRLHPFPEPGIRDFTEDTDILINATPLGMKGMGGDFPGFDFLDRLKEGTLVCDLIYSPVKTRLLREAEMRKLRTLGGISMLIEQALEADRLYLGADIMREKAYKRVIDNLRGKVEGI